MPIWPNAGVHALTSAACMGKNASDDIAATSYN